MTDLLGAGLLLLSITLCGGLVRIIRGPTPSDRLMAAQLVGSAGIAALLLLAPVVRAPALVDTALVFALLAAVPAG